MSGRNAVAAEMTELILQVNGMLQRAERLAESCRLVDPKYFRGAQLMMSLAAGDLHQKGLLLTKPPEEPAAAESAEKVG